MCQCVGVVALMKLGSAFTHTHTNTHTDTRLSFLRSETVITHPVAAMVNLCVIVRLSGSAVKCSSKGQM